mgnify:CR=1 FL=1
MEQIEILTSRYPALEACKADILVAFEVLRDSYAHGGKLLVCGNGGSAADAVCLGGNQALMVKGDQQQGELMKGFKSSRKLDEVSRKKLEDIDSAIGSMLADNLQGALPAIALDGHSALSTAYMNDCEPLMCFAQQVNGYGRESDVLLSISTSGNSKNVVYAAVTAKAKGMKVIGLTGQKESKLSAMADVCIRVPETETYKIQELHLPVYHSLCLMLEEEFFND